MGGSGEVLPPGNLLPGRVSGSTQTHGTQRSGRNPEASEAAEARSRPAVDMLDRSRCQMEVPGTFFFNVPVGLRILEHIEEKEKSVRGQEPHHVSIEFPSCIYREHREVTTRFLVEFPASRAPKMPGFVSVKRRYVAAFLTWGQQRALMAETNRLLWQRPRSQR